MNAKFPLDLSVDTPKAKRKLNQYLELARELTYPWILILLRMYVKEAVSAPAITVGTEWGVTAMPNTLRTRTHRRLAAISMGTAETFVIERIRDDEEAPWDVLGFVSVDRETLLKANGVEYLAGLRRLYPELVFEDAPYRDMEGTGLTMWFSVLPPIEREDEQLLLWDVQGSMEAARVLADRLLGRGSMQARYTNPFLASSVIGLIE